MKLQQVSEVEAETLKRRQMKIFFSQRRRTNIWAETGRLCQSLITRVGFEFSRRCDMKETDRWGRWISLLRHRLNSKILLHSDEQLLFFFFRLKESEWCFLSCTFTSSLHSCFFFSSTVFLLLHIIFFRDKRGKDEKRKRENKNTVKADKKTDERKKQESRRRKIREKRVERLKKW